jgi:hypothetical protein
MHSIDYEYTDKDIAAWGGLRLVQELMERIDFRGMLDEAGLPERGSNRAYDSSTIIEGFIVSVILGAKRLAHSGTIRHDEVSSARYSVGKAAWLRKAPSAVSSSARVWRATTRSCAGSTADGSRWLT